MNEASHFTSPAAPGGGMATTGARSDLPHASLQRAQPSAPWVVSLPEARKAHVRQLFIVGGMGMDRTTATVSMHARDADGRWMRILSTPGYVGKNGMCPDAEHREGCGRTPIGVYRFNRAFGIAPDPGCAIPYTRVRDGVYWSGDEARAYNRMVELSDCPDLDTARSEHLIDYEYPYQYCLSISFNAECAPGRGSAIFLHCLSLTHPYTGGCVAIPESVMKRVMQRVREDCVVVIDTVERLGCRL